MLYSLDDITIIPANLSHIEHRSECNVFDKAGKLPIFAAPMSCVINTRNYMKFEDNGIHTIIPRNIDFKTRFNLSKEVFAAVSLSEFEQYIALAPKFEEKHYICVDIANGHMKKLYDLSRTAKDVHKDNLILMVGNIANPETYKLYAEIGVDYVRAGIGSGNVCTTSANTGIHYPMASLIDDCYSLKLQNHYNTKIVADGGFKNFDQIIKALAIGADYVMIGQILAKSTQACGKAELIKGETLREYYGMSTKRAQKEFGKEGNTTAEGIVKWVKVEYTIEKWVDNFKSYLKSAMSYCDCKTLEEFNDYGYWEVMTPTGRAAFYK